MGSGRLFPYNTCHISSTPHNQTKFTGPVKKTVNTNFTKSYIFKDSNGAYKGRNVFYTSIVEYNGQRMPY